MRSPTDAQLERWLTREGEDDDEPDPDDAYERYRDARLGL
jgi:hypothetical protein